MSAALSAATQAGAAEYRLAPKRAHAGSQAP